MNTYTLKTEAEQREAKAKAIIALKFGQVEVGSLAYWLALSNKEAV